MGYNISVWEKKFGRNAFVGSGQCLEVNKMLHTIESMQLTPWHYLWSHITSL